MAVAPAWGQRRVRARASLALATMHFEGAASGRRTAGWYRSATDANAANGPALTRLRELSRDLQRNNGWARRGIRVIANNTVGWGITAKVVAESADVAKRASEMWSAWSRTPRCDYDRRLPFTGLQRLVMRTVASSGEALIVRERANRSDGLGVPLRIRVLEPDHLDLHKDGISGHSGPIIQGIELDGRGRRVAYWLYEEHPGANRLFGNRFESKRVLAEDVIHVYDVERAGQMRGVPWLCATIAKLNDLDEYDDAVLMQAKIAACFGAFVQDLDADPAAVGEQSATDPLLESLEPGQIQYLKPGQSISFAQPPSAANHGTLSNASLHRIAAGLDITFEDLTNDYSQVNFSSARMARLSHWAAVHGWRWDMLIPHFCDGVFAWFMEMAAAMEEWREVPTAEWTPPPMPMLEPDKEGLAYSRLIRNGIMTLPEAIREQGQDPDAHLAEIAEANAKLDELKIVLDSDPRRTSAGGQGQQVTGSDQDTVST
jgi:lambda family phage portal protein